MNDAVKDAQLDTAFAMAEGSAMAAEFDAAFYLERYAGALSGDETPLQHFLSVGWRELMNPAEWFSVLDYLASNEDVLCSGMNPFQHYLQFGRSEGRVVKPVPSRLNENSFRNGLKRLSEAFDEQFYREKNGTLDYSLVDPMLQYITVGWKQGRDPCSWFSVNDYLQSYPDINAAAKEPFSHYLEYGKSEGRQPNGIIRNDIKSEFDRDYYLTQSPALNGLDPLNHFVTFGWKLGFNPRNDFSVSHYLRMNPDVKKAEMNPFWHYVMAGRSEGRSVYPINDRKIAVNNMLPKLLFIGHDALHAGAEVVLLEIIRWFTEHTQYPLKLIILGTGQLVGNYAKYADTYVLVDELEQISDQEELDEFLDDDFLACYVNTVASARFYKIIEKSARLKTVPIILHVHEMEMVIRVFEDDFRTILPKVNSIIAVSTAVRDVLINIFDCNPERIFQSNAFIRLQAQSAHDAMLKRLEARQILDLKSDDFVVIGCGTVYSRKGPDLFLDVALKSIERSAIRSSKFIWIGWGEELDDIQATVKRRGLEDSIRFIGLRDDASLMIAAADVFFLSSREDPFPLVCLEAAQYGIPTIYFKGATGISEFCGEDAGLGVDAFDTDAALEAIKLYANRPVRLEKAGSTARARLLDGYTADKRVLEIFIHLAKVADIRPAISVIVPTYNHQKFIRDRVDSILQQSIGDIEVIILDDCSTDATVDMIAEYMSDPRVKLVKNEENSGGPFTQWAKGIRMAASPLVWIAEGDDFISDDFLATLLPAFADDAVNLAFCKTEIVDEFGTVKPNGLAPYHRLVDFPFESGSLKMDGLQAVEAGFGMICLSVNASASIFRKSSIINALDCTATYRMCGDWFTYLAALTDGKLFYSALPTNFFRRHSSSTVHRLEGTKTYFEERLRIANFILAEFRISRKTMRSMLAHLDSEWSRFSDRNKHLSRQEVFDTSTLHNLYSTRKAKAVYKIGLYVHGMLFSKGGIERLAAQLANELSRRGHAVFLFCREWGGAAPVYSLNESVEVISVFNEDDLGASKAAMRREIAKRDLDIFVPMLSEWLFEPVIESCTGLGIPMIASEHNDPGKIAELWWSHKERLECYAKLNGVHLLLERFRASLPEDFGPKIFVIPNGVALDKAAQPDRMIGRPKRIIGIGRLERQKRFDRLINAFALEAPNLPEWTLDIFGEGSERHQLQTLIDSHGLHDRIALRGTTTKIKQELSASSIFVLPSEFEGFGIVILEAKQSALPSIAYASCNGPNELIKHEKDGLLVQPDETGASLAMALRYLAIHRDVRSRMGAQAYQSVQDFDILDIVTLWEKMIADVVTTDENKAETMARPIARLNRHAGSTALPNLSTFDKDHDLKNSAVSLVNMASDSHESGLLKVMFHQPLSPIQMKDEEGEGTVLLPRQRTAQAARPRSLVVNENHKTFQVASPGNEDED